MQDSKTISGSIVHITDGAEADAREILVNINPVQDLHGYTKPWVGGAGKNKLPDTRASGNTTISGVTFTTNSDGSVTMNGTATETIYYNLILRTAAFNLASGEYIVSGLTGSSAIIIVGKAATNTAIGNTNNMQTFTLSESINVFAFIQIANGATFNNVKAYPMIRLSSVTDATYEPYENICPITGWDDVSVYVSPTDDIADATTTTTTLPSTTYGGTIDLVSGVLVDKMGITDLSGLTWTTRYTGTVNRALSAQVPSSFVGYPSTEFNAVAEQYEAIRGISGASYLANPDNVDVGLYWYSNPQSPTTTNVYVVCPLATSPSGKLVYELATPTTAQLTGQQIELLRDCFVWADAGDITVTYETELVGIFHKIKINGVSVYAPNDFTLDREDVYQAEYTSCTGKTIADRIGWKYADMSLQWDTLPQESLSVLLALNGAFSITFINENGSTITENVIRRNTGMTGTRFTDDLGDSVWKGVSLSISFLDVH